MTEIVVTANLRTSLNLSVAQGEDSVERMSQDWRHAVTMTKEQLHVLSRISRGEFHLIVEDSGAVRFESV